MRAAWVMLVAFAFAAPSFASFTVTGSVAYEDREWDYDGFTGAMPELPIRYADVEIVNASNNSILAEGFSDGSGNFSIFVSSSGTFNIRVRVVSDSLNARNGTANISRVRVEDFSSGALFTSSSSVFSNVNSNIDTGTLVVPAVTESHGKLGNPFNIFDLMIDSVLYITGPLADSRTGTTATGRWPSTGSGSYASGSTTVIGYESAYDDSIILHELGHVFHNIYSDSDNPGGSHGFSGTDQDPRLSFGEGWATYFEMCVLDFSGHPNPGIYVNTTGDPGPGNLSWHARAEDGSPFSAAKGAASEWAIVCATWDMADDELTSDAFPVGVDDDPYDLSLDWSGSNPEREAWEVLVGPIASASNLTHIDFWDGWFTPVNHGFYDETKDVHAAWGIHFYPDDDEFNGSAATATPLTPDGTWSGRKTIYYSASNPPVPGVGDRDYFSMFLASGTDIVVETRYDGGDARSLVDPYLDIILPNGSTVAASDNDSGDGRNARIAYTTTQSGTFYARVRELDSYRDYGHYNIRAYITGTTSAPAIDSVSPTSGLISGGTTVTITGANFVGSVDVRFGSVDATQVNVTSFGSLTCVVPRGVSLGPTDIVVSNDNGDSPPLVDGYAYDSVLGSFGTPSIGSTITVGVLGPANAAWGVVKDTQLGPKTKKGILWQIDFGPDFEILHDAFRTSDPVTTALGQGNTMYTIPANPALIGTSLYFESVFDNNGPAPGNDLWYGNFLEIVIEP